MPNPHQVRSLNKPCPPNALTRVSIMGSTLPKIRTHRRTTKTSRNVFGAQLYSRETGKVTQFIKDFQWNTFKQDEKNKTT